MTRPEQQVAGTAEQPPHALRGKRPRMVGVGGGVGGRCEGGVVWEAPRLEVARASRQGHDDCNGGIRDGFWRILQAAQRTSLH